MIRAASRETRKLPLAMTSCCRSQSCSVVSRSGLEIDRPALFTTRSTPPKARTAARNASATASASLTSAAPPTQGGGADLLRGGLRLGPVEVGDDDAGALAGQPLRDRLPDAAGRAGDQGHARGERLGLRHALELGLLQRPVLDAELLRLVDGGVGGDRLGTAHDVDRVDVELTG